LQAHQAAQTVLEQSVFVPPASLVGHQVWTYVAPGTAGWPNPEGDEVETETFRELWRKSKSKRGRTKENLFEHLRGLAADIGVTVVTDNTSPKWLTQFAVPQKLDMVQRQAVFDTLELCTRFGRAGATWFVADLETPNP
jgi:hypothetical protein